MTKCSFLVMIICMIFAAVESSASACRLELSEFKRLTYAGGDSHTNRGNGRAICVDPSGTLHIVWEDARAGNFEIYYRWIKGDSLSPEIRITSSPERSTHACVTADSNYVYVVWQELKGAYHDLHYARLQGGRVVVSRRLTRIAVDSKCPVIKLDRSGNLHLAWHEGPYGLSGIYYGRIEGDSLVDKTPICNEHPGAIRPDFDCDEAGNILMAWYEPGKVSAKLWDGSSWSDEMEVSDIEGKSWRISVVSAGQGKWAVAWYGSGGKGSFVYAAFYDQRTGKWYGKTQLNRGNSAYYPNAWVQDGIVHVIWEESHPETRSFTLVGSCFDGKRWSKPREILRDRVMTRYCSMYGDQNGRIHAVWYSNRAGNYEIYYGILETTP